MRASGKLSSSLGCIATLLSLFAFTLGSAALAPAMVLTFVALPLALAAALLGSWRLAIIAAYFSIAAWLVVPLSYAIDFRVDYLLVLAGAFGTLIAVRLYVGHKSLDG